MAKKPKVLGLIPARGGSKRIPSKNIKCLSGKPLIGWTIQAALNSNYVDQVIVSTEDEEIAKTAKKWGADVPFLRHKRLALDNSTRNEVVGDVLNKVKGFEYVILLQPTSPLRSAIHIDEAYSQMINRSCKNCVSVKLQHPSPQYIFQIGKEKKLTPYNKINENYEKKHNYIVNGAIYICEIDFFKKSNLLDPFVASGGYAYVMSEFLSLDLDHSWQWSFAELAINQNSEQNNNF